MSKLKGFKELKRLYPEAGILNDFIEKDDDEVFSEGVYLHFPMGVRVYFQQSPDNNDPEYVRRRIAEVLLNFRDFYDDRLKELGIKI